MQMLKRRKVEQEEEGKKELLRKIVLESGGGMEKEREKGSDREREKGQEKEEVLDDEEEESTMIMDEEEEEEEEGHLEDRKEEQKEEVKDEEKEKEEEEEEEGQKDEAKQELKEEEKAKEEEILSAKNKERENENEDSRIQTENKIEEVVERGEVLSIRLETTKLAPVAMSPSSQSAFSHFKECNRTRSTLLINPPPPPSPQENINTCADNNHHNAATKMAYTDAHYNNHNTNNSEKNENNLVPTITLQTGPSTSSTSTPSTTSSAIAHQQQQQQQPCLPNSVIHNKDLWLEVSMHAQIVSNLAAMAQGQRLSAPPLDMIRSHLNHINMKVKELTLLYSAPTLLPSPPSSFNNNNLNSSNTSAIPFAYPPGMTQLPTTQGWLVDGEEYKPDYRNFPPKVSNTNFSAGSTPWANQGMRAGVPSLPTSHNSSPSSSHPCSPITSSPPRQDTSDADAADAAAILSSSATRLMSINPPQSRVAVMQTPHQFHHYTMAPAPISRFRANMVGQSPAAAAMRTLKFSPHRLTPDSQTSSSPAEIPARAAFVATPVVDRENSPPLARGGRAGKTKKRKRPQPSCDQCHTMYTPEWRRGPRGAGTLCNACGLRYSRQEKRQRKREEHMQTKKKASIDAILNP